MYSEAAASRKHAGSETPRREPVVLRDLPSKRISSLGDTLKTGRLVCSALIAEAPVGAATGARRHVGVGLRLTDTIARTRKRVSAALFKSVFGGGGGISLNQKRVQTGETSSSSDRKTICKIFDLKAKEL